jgi:uncharacterized membrane protein
VGTVLKDIMRLGPAPTLRREIPAAVVNLLLTASVVIWLLTTEGSVVIAIGLGALGLVYTVVRLLGAARRSARGTDRR